MKIIYLAVSVVFVMFSKTAFNQTCSAVSATYNITESRCAATGSVQILAAGGSGNYQYKISGPVNTSYTSANLVTALSAGRYQVTINDITANCFFYDSVTVPGNYITPVFSLSTTDVTCFNGNDGTLAVTNQNYGRAPYSYQIVAPSASGIGTMSAAGIFTGLIPGFYFVQLTDSCGAVQTRNTSILNFDWWIDNYPTVKSGCDSVSVTINLRDSKGNISPSTVFDLFRYGASIVPGDTTWYNANTFKYFVGQKRSVELFAKDNCGNIKSAVWTDPVIPSVAGYVLISDKICSTFTAKLANKVNLTNPSFCLFDNNNVSIACNNTGDFYNVPYGSYCIKTSDVCYDTTITRCFVVDKLVPSVNAIVTTQAYCQNFTARITGQTNLFNPNYCLYDSASILISCNASGVFSNLPFGQYCIRIANDPACFDTSIVRCFTVNRAVPYVGPSVNIINVTCNSFTAVLNDTAQVFNPSYCLFTAAHILISCNSTGIFTNLPFGTYCIDVRNDPTCFDTTISRCFTVTRSVPAVGSTVVTSNKTCSSFTATITGQGNLNNPQYCLFTGANTLVSCNSSGIFTNIPFGSYEIRIQNDPLCYDTLISRAFAEWPVPVSFNVSASKSCAKMGTTDIVVSMTSGLAAYNYALYSPSEALVQSATTSSASYLFSQIPGLPVWQEYKVIVTDVCGRKDSMYIIPSISIINRVVTITQRCPSGMLPNGSADVLVDITDNNIIGSIIPKIIKKNGTTVSINATTTVGYQYTFRDLAPATYVFETYALNCNRRLYDTVVVKTYLYPSLLGSKIYYCNDSSFSVNINVSGGVGPYMYEIIGSVPASPTINTPPQSSPVFNINNGTNYTLIRLRAVDACGNAGLHDASVLPFRNFTVFADTTECVNQKLTLRVDSLPNTGYTWYKRIVPADSIIVGTGPTFIIPFLQLSDTGRYFCRINLNGGCLYRVANFVITANCGTVLAQTVNLRGIKAATGRQLQWDEVQQGVVRFDLQRSDDNGLNFSSIKSYTLSGLKTTACLDQERTGSSYLYRLKLYYTDGRIIYSNIVKMSNTTFGINVFPNPTKDMLFVSVNVQKANNYSFELINLTGQRIMNKTYNELRQSVIPIPRMPATTNGIYTLIVTDLKTNEKEFFKVIYQ